MICTSALGLLARLSDEYADVLADLLHYTSLLLASNPHHHRYMT